MDLNNVSLTGRLVRDPEISYLNNNMVVMKGSLAVNGYKKDEVNYIDITVWGKAAESCNSYVHKGSRIAVEGSIKQERWTDQQSGQNRSKITINCSRVVFLDPVQTQGYPQNYQPQQQNNQPQQNQNNQQNNQNKPVINSDPWQDNNDNIPF